MITNIFSIFDPATSINLSVNWIILLTLISAYPINYWITESRATFTISSLTNFVSTEFNLILANIPENLALIVALFLTIITSNLVGLLPITFTNFSHISNTLILALPLWVGAFSYGWYNNTNDSLVHLIPNGTPSVLMPFIVLIETISALIRPLTLAIRLAANIIAGHLLVSLLISASSATSIFILPILNSAQLALISLELGVAGIQAYVFSVLISLYVAESN